MLTVDETFLSGDQEKIWQKFCGFLDLSLTEFMEIQERLLMDQINLVHESILARKFMPNKPKDTAEFRKTVPLTVFDDYAEYLNAKNEEVLAVKPYCWGHTSGRGGEFKWAPYMERNIERFIINCLATMILASADKKGDVNIGPGFRFLQSMPPAPYMSGVINQIICPLTSPQVIPPLGKYDNLDFESRIQLSFQLALHSGVDVLSSLTSVLVKMGERFTESSGKLSFNRQMLHPQIMMRLIRAYMSSKKEGRGVLPKDLWPVKGLLCYGTDTTIYKEQLMHYWGRKPYEVYGGTEIQIAAMDSWNKKTMTFTPYTSFFEFIPEQEWLKTRENKDYKPSTVLMDEVQPGERYEIVITSFYGMPFLRYRVGDLIRIVALEDTETGIKLPQMLFDSRADDLIDIASFPRLDEKTIWQAIVNTGIKYEDWSARKEYEQNNPVIRLYIEPKEEIQTEELERLIHQELRTIHKDYKDLEDMLGIRPLRVNPLSAGSFQRYREERQKAGADLAHLKPPHMNAPDSIIEALLRLS